DVARLHKVKALHVVDDIYALAFSPRGDRLLAASNGRSLVLFDLPSRAIVARVDIPYGVAGVGFTDGGKHAYFASASGQVSLYEPETLVSVKTLSLGEDVAGVKLSESGEFLVYCTSEKVERVNRRTGARERFVLGEAPIAMGVSPDGVVV